MKQPRLKHSPSPGVSRNQTDFSAGTASYSDARILFCIIRLHCFIALLSALCFEGDFHISRSHKPSPSSPRSHTVRVSLIRTFLHHVVWQICPCGLSSRLAVWRQIFSKSRFSRVARRNLTPKPDHTPTLSYSRANLSCGCFMSTDSNRLPTWISNCFLPL